MEHVNRLSDNLQEHIALIRPEWMREIMHSWVFGAEEALNEAGTEPGMQLIAAYGSEPESGWLIVFLGDGEKYLQCFDVFDWTDGDLQQARWTEEEYRSWIADDYDQRNEGVDAYGFNAVLLGKYRWKYCDLDYGTGRPFTVGERFHERKFRGGGKLTEMLRMNRGSKKRRTQNNGSMGYYRFADLYQGASQKGKFRRSYSVGNGAEKKGFETKSKARKCKWSVASLFMRRSYTRALAKPKLALQLQARSAIRLGLASRLKTD